MRIRLSLTGRARAIVVALLAAAFVLVAIPEARAQVGAAGTGGGGSRGSGGRSRDDDRNKPRPKRNEQEPVNPETSRSTLQTTLAGALERGTAAPAFLVNLFDKASTQPLPASTQSRKALAEALGTLKGTKVDPAAAVAIAENVAAAVNAEGIAAEELATKRDAMKEPLAAAGMSEDQSAAALAALDRVVADQQDEQIKAVSDILEEVQREGEAPGDSSTKLAEALTALAAADPQPAAESVANLSENLVKAVDSAQLTNKEKAQLAHDVKLLLNGASLERQEVFPILNEVRQILKAGLAKQADAQKVAQDLQAIQKSLATPAAAN